MNNANFERFLPPVRIDLIRRRKTDGPAKHYGIRVWYSPMLNRVFDFQFNHEVRNLTLDQFAAGLPMTTDYSVTDPRGLAAASTRLREVFDARPRYDFLAQNCEHIARYVVFGHRKSDQVSGLVAAGMAVGIVILMLRVGG